MTSSILTLIFMSPFLARLVSSQSFQTAREDEIKVSHSVSPIVRRLSVCWLGEEEEKFSISCARFWVSSARFYFFHSLSHPHPPIEGTIKFILFFYAFKSWALLPLSCIEFTACSAKSSSSLLSSLEDFFLVFYDFSFSKREERESERARYHPQKSKYNIFLLRSSALGGSHSYCESFWAFSQIQSGVGKLKKIFERAFVD